MAFSYIKFNFALAFLVGVLMLAPALYFRYGSGFYEGIDFFKSSGEEVYLAQIQEVYDGHFLLGNIYTADGKNMPSATDRGFLPWLVAGLGKIFGLSAPDVNLVTKFLFPFLLSLLVGALFYELTKQRLYALLAAAFIMLAPATTSFFWPNWWWEILTQGNFPASDYQFLSYSRPINPQASSFFFYGYFLLLWKFLYGAESGSKKILGGAAALIFGLSFYSYFFVFSFLSVFSVFLLFFYLFKNDYSRAKLISYIIFFGLVVGSYSIFQLFKNLYSPLYIQAAERVGALFSRRFIFSRIWLGTFLVFLIFYRRLREEKFGIFALIFLATTFVLTNQQVLTGHIIPAPSHYNWYYFAPFAGVFFLYLAWRWAEQLLAPPRLYYLAFLLVLLFFWVGFLFQLGSYLRQETRVLHEQRYSEVLNWLRNHAQKDEVILGNETLSLLTLGYTRNNIYYQRGLTDLPVPMERLKHHFFIYLFLDGVDDKDAAEYFVSRRELVGARLYGEYWRQLKGCSGCFPNEILEELVAEYKDFLKKDFISELKKYRLDYIVWDMTEDPNWEIERFFKEKLYEKDGIRIYKI